jgi:hypothetical protein
MRTLRRLFCETTGGKLRKMRVSNQIMEIQAMLRRLTQKEFRPEKGSLLLLSEMSICTRDPVLQDKLLEALMLKSGEREGMAQLVPLLGLLALPSDSAPARQVKQLAASALLDQLPAMDQEGLKKCLWHISNVRNYTLSEELQQVLWERIRPLLPSLGLKELYLYDIFTLE